MKNVYKWRIVTNKYLYLTDENNAGPFIFNKVTKERIYECSGTPQVDDYGVDEGKISQIVSEIRDAHTYETMFNNMVNLAMCDADAQKLHFLTYDNYFNLDSEECVQEAVTPKCEGYEPVFKISAHTIDDTEVSYTFFPERNEQDKTVRYNLDLGIPRGLTGEKGEAGESGCQGAKGDDGKSAVIVNADATIYTLPVGSTPEAQVEVVPESATTEDENQYVFHFNFGVPQGSQGERGVAGRTGAKGKDAIITDASATIDPLEYGQQPQVSVSAITTPTQEENQTELRFHFDIPAGPQGEVGPAGAPSVIHEARVERIDTLEPGSDATVTVEAIPYEQSANSYDLVFNFGIPRGADGSSGGGGGGWTYNIDDPTFIEDAGISVPYGQFNTVYHPGDGEADVTLTIHYPSSWGQGGGGETDIKHRYEATENGSDSLSEGVKDIVNGVAYPKAIASGVRSHAEGIGFGANEMPNAIGVATHTEGRACQAVGDYSHAEGWDTLTRGSHSHAEGLGTYTTNLSEHAEGQYNVSHSEDRTEFNNSNGCSTVSSIGIGEDDEDRKNAIEVMQNGDVYIYGVGNYAGTDIKCQNSEVETLQDVLNNLHTDTHRPIQVDGTEVLGNDVTPLNLSGGTNISLSDDGSGEVTIDANIPKTQHELIYFDPERTDNGYEGLITAQLMYEDGIVVDNQADFNKCTGDTSWEEIDFTMHDVAVDYITEIISCNPYKNGRSGTGNDNILQNSGFTKGAIINSSNEFWGYDSSKDYITAKFNDDWGDRTAFIFNEDTPDKYFIHDALYGYSDVDDGNDAIGLAFFAFNKSVFTDGSTQSYDGVTVDETSYLKTTKLQIDLGVRPSSKNVIMNLGMGQNKRKPDEDITYLADAYWRNGSTNRPNTTLPQPYKSFNPAGLNGFSIIGGGSSTIQASTMLNPGSYDGDDGPIGFVRCVTERNGNVYRFKFSQPSAFTWTENYKHTIGPQVVASEIIIDMDEYKIHYKPSGTTSFTTIDVTDSTQKALFDEFKNNDVYYGFWQLSTPKGAIYNISYTRGSGSSLSNLILNTYDDTVWQYTYDGWQQLTQYVPLDLFSGSHLNYNHITEKLWYSNGSRIYEIKSDGGGGGGETDIKHRYNSSVDSLSEGVQDTVNGVAYPKAIASGVRSHAEGIGFGANEMPNAIGIATHTEGKSTTAEGNYSHAEGENTRAVGKASHAEGIGADGEYIDVSMRITCDGKLIIEKWDVPARYNLSSIAGATFTVKDLDKVKEKYSVTESTIFMIDSANANPGEDNHFRFDSVKVNFTDISGTTYNNIDLHGGDDALFKTGAYTHYSDGYYLHLFLTHGNTGAYGEGSHVEGGYNVANDDYSHAEGWSTIADGVASHAEGGATVTRGDYSHAGGYGTVADKDYMTAIGKFNATGETGTLFAVGDGADDGNRSNVFSINGQTKKVTLSNNGGGIKFQTGGTSNVVWNTSGGTTDLNTFVPTNSIPVGSIQMYAGSSSPTGWLLCNGDAVSRTTYSGLFNIIGTTYGVGDGSTTFNLPNLQQKFPLGALAGGTIGIYFDTDTTSWQSWGTDLGSTGGEDTTKLYATNLPNHKHSITTWATTKGTEDSVEAEASGGTQASAKTDDTIYTSGDLKVVDGTPGPFESQRQNLNNTPLFLAINFIIKY